MTGYSRLSTVTGWLLAVVYIFYQYITVQMPRSPKVSALRDDLHQWHYLIGSILLALVIARLIGWRRDRAVTTPAGLSPAAVGWTRTLALVTYLLILVAPFLGVLFGWSDGFALRLFGIPVPNLVPENRALWMFTGYFHSGIGFTLLLLNLTALLTAGYTTLRYGRGLLTAFPPGYGVMAFIGLTATTYAFSTFRSPEPGPRSVAIFWGVCAVVAALSWFIHRNRAPRRVGPAPAGLRVAGAAVVVAIVGFGAYGPHLLFRVTSWPTTAVTASGIREPVMKVALTPETDYERTVGAETYKWCRFCHTMKRGEKALVGPNLYGVFGQRAGTAPSFAYSEAMVKARDRGLVWNDATIADYISHPDVFMPGTAMIISSGPVTDPKKRAAVVAILKRETMQ